MAKKKDTGLDSCCDIIVFSRRKRLVDTDGISVKAALDGIVHKGILPDDNAKIIGKITYYQEQAKEDETIITINWEV